MTGPETAGDNPRLRRARELYLSRASLDGRGPYRPRVNCAEAILRSSLADEECLPEGVDSFRSIGFGKAPGGLCGAVYAAERVLRLKGAPDGELLIGEFHREFNKVTGSSVCADIRIGKAAACRACVETTAVLLDRLLAQDP